MNRHNYRDRHQRNRQHGLSRSASRLIETAFVSSSSFNSAEDLDEVDRLANHPVLRSVPLGCGVNHADLFRQREIGKLRKSRSVTGTETAAAGGGIRFAIWSGDCDGVASSPLENKGSAGNISRPFTTEGRLPVSRAATVAVQKLSPATSAASAPCSSWVYDELTLPRDAAAATISSGGGFEDDPVPATKCVVRAVIENGAAPRQPSSPPSSRSSDVVWRGQTSNTPPNTAPLPAKFSRAPVPQNLLRLQRPAASEIESSSVASNNEISVMEDDEPEDPAASGIKGTDPPQRRVCPPAPKPKRSMAIANSLASWKNNNNNNRDNSISDGKSLPSCQNATALNLPSRIKSPGNSSSAHSSTTGGRFKLPLPLGKHRNRLGKAVGGGADADAESTSSGESTPQKKKSPSSQTPPPASSLLIKPAGVPMPRPMTAAVAAAATTTVRRGAEVAKPGLGLRKKRLFFGGGVGASSGGSSCSSAMSSLESIRSNASDGVQGGESWLLK